MGELNVRSEHACFGGTIGFYRHESICCRSVMNFSVYVPPQAMGQAGKKVPVLYFLSGLTCSDENFMAKSGAKLWRRSWESCWWCRIQVRVVPRLQT